MQGMPSGNCRVAAMRRYHRLILILCNLLVNGQDFH